MGQFNKEKLQKLRRVDSLFRSIYFFPKNKRQYASIVDESNRSIVIMGMMMIGDTIMALPSLRVIRRNFPSAHITLAGGDAVKTIVEGQGVVDDFVTIKSPWLHNDYSFKNVYSFIKGLFRINRRKYDLAIEFKGDWRNIFYMNFIRSKRKVSFNLTGGEYMLTDVISPDDTITHYIEEWLYLLRKIGLDVKDNEHIPHLSLTESDKSYIYKFKEENRLQNRTVIGVHPGASQDVKKWDEAKYAELIIELSKIHKDCTFLIYQGPSEENSVKRVEVALADRNVHYIVVSKKLKEYVLLISICQLMICNDSGAAHIAGAFSIPTVIIFGNVDPQYVTPYGSIRKRVISHDLVCKPCYQSICKYGTNQCIRDVSLAEVFRATIEIFP